MGAESAPVIVSVAANRDFDRIVREAGLDPGNPWVGGFVDEVWRRGRHIYESSDLRLRERTILEFGCNIGATAIVLALLGARCTAIDPDPVFLRIARANAVRYGVAERITFLHVPDTTRMPFESARFDLVTCGSVLEYVEPRVLSAVQREIDRVLKPDGIIVVSGTSNRLWPREVLSGTWFINYLPRAIDRFLPTAKPRQRGVFPWRVRHAFGDYDNLDREDRGRAYLTARQRMYPGRRWRLGFAAANAVAQLCGTTLGLWTPTIGVTLKKKVDERSSRIG